jgi:phenylacetate-coenzyme A ligase PaaK-like adenylate-forming protein
LDAVLEAELSDLTVPGLFQVSSSTSGDPRHVYTSLDDRHYVADLYARTFAPEVVTTGVAFAPSLRILRGLGNKAALPGRSAVLRMQL